MNRHFQAYNALPTEVLGTPIRQEPAKPRDGEWKPLRPGYESRTLAGGAVEVRTTGVSAQDLKRYVEPAQQSGGVMPEDVHGDESGIAPLVAPTEWQSGAPPSVGWRETTDSGLCANFEARYWNGNHWSPHVWLSTPCAGRLHEAMRGRTIVSTVRWRGPRLTGADWPEPQQ